MSDQRLPFHAGRPVTRLRPFNTGRFSDVGFVPSNDRPAAGEKARGVVTLDGSWIVATFSHRHLPFVRAIKSIHGAHEMPPPKFDTARMSWLVHIGNIRQVRHLAELYGWESTPAVQAIPDMDPGDVPLLVSAEGEQLVLIGAYREETWKVLADGGATYERRSGRWFIPYESALDLIFDLQKLGRIKFVGDRNDLMDRLDEAAEMLRLSRALANTTGFEIPDTVTRELRPFQIPGAEYLTRSVRGFAWATTGAGKTTCAAVALEKLGAFPALIIPPSGLKTNWLREFAAILPHRTVHVCEGRTPSAMLDMPDVWIANYDIVHYWREFFIDLGLVGIVADEGHRLSNPKARWTKAAVAISESMPYEAARYILTATPVRNRRAELAPQLAFIGREGEFGDKKQLREDERLSRRMRTVCAWRPDPKEVLVSLGVVNASGDIEPVEDRILVDGDPKVMAEYRHAEANIMQYLTEKAREKAIKLGEDPDSAAVEAAMKLDSAAHLMVVNTLVGIANRAKIKPAREWVRDFQSSGDKILVFAERKIMMDALHEETGWPQIRGGVSKPRRIEIEDQFQGRTGEDLDGVILQYQSGGEGLTLTEAYHVLHAELRWSPGDHIQADGRCIVAGSLVHTDRGALPIEAVVKGDRVLTHRGRWRPVTATSHREASETIEIETVRHLDLLRCTPDHLLWVKDSVSGRIGWKPAEELAQADLLALPRPSGDGVTTIDFDLPTPDLSCLGCHQEKEIVTHGLCARCRHQYKKADRPFPDEYVTGPQKRRLTSIRSGPITVTNELLWAFGVWLGDGWLKRTKMVHNAVGICGHADEHEQVTRAITAISEAFGVEMTSPLTTRENTCEMYLYSRELADVFASWFFAEPLTNKVKDTGKGSQGVIKRLAPWMTGLDDDQAAAVLHGYVAADGHWSPDTGMVAVKTVSPHLAHQAAVLAAQSGFAPNVNRINHGPKQRQPYLISWQRREPVRTRTDLRQSDDDHVWCPVVRARRVTDPVMVYDLTVAEDHSFVVGQAAVHNCWFRMNDPHNITAHYLVCAGTIDELRMDVLDGKRAEMATVTDGDRMSIAAGSTFNDVLSILLRKALGTEK